MGIRCFQASLVCTSGCGVSRESVEEEGRRSLPSPFRPR